MITPQSAVLLLLEELLFTQNFMGYPIKNVNLQFKLLSAIGIIIIVSGHCYHGGISLAYEWFPTYSFNLSLFVFISGYFYKPKNENTVLQYIWKRIKRLLLPAYL